LHNLGQCIQGGFYAFAASQQTKCRENGFACEFVLSFELGFVEEGKQMGSMRNHLDFQGPNMVILNEDVFGVFGHYYNRSSCAGHVIDLFEQRFIG